MRKKKTTTKRKPPKHSKTLRTAREPLYVEAVITDLNDEYVIEEGYMSYSPHFDDFVCLSKDVDGKPFITFCEKNLFFLKHKNPPDRVALVIDAVKARVAAKEEKDASN